MIMMAFQNNGEKMVYSENNRIGSFLHMGPTSTCILNIVLLPLLIEIH